MFQLSKRSLSKLSGVHPDLIKVVKRAIELTEVDFGVIEGVRTLDRQQMLYDSGASRTMKSKHLTGHAVDVMAYEGGVGSWSWGLYLKINEAFQKAADELDIEITWGGSWESFRDGPHFQLGK